MGKVFAEQQLACLLQEGRCITPQQAFQQCLIEMFQLRAQSNHIPIAGDFKIIATSPGIVKALYTQCNLEDDCF
jgi:hypothetical protein